MTTQVAFLFPGQGSQAVGMGKDVFDASIAARQVFETVDEALSISLSTLCFQGPDETLRETINAQPAIVTVSLALLAAFQEALSPQNSSWSLPLTPSYTAGHSVGEYAALVAAGALDLKSAALLVRERGRLMHHEGTVCPGGMAAVIGMEAESLQPHFHRNRQTHRTIQGRGVSLWQTSMLQGRLSSLASKTPSSGPWNWQRSEEPNGLSPSLSVELFIRP